MVLVLIAMSFAVRAQSPVSAKQAAKEAKVSSDLYQVILNNGPVAPAASADGLVVETNQVIVGDKIAIEAIANNEDGEGLLNQLKALGLTGGVAYKRMVFGYLPIDKLRELKNVSSLSFARSHYAPITNTGSVTSQGDAALKADVARTTYSVTGAGVKVGVISDSYNRLGGAPAGVASGDLPVVEIVEESATASNIDEGRAMAEIVHDVAPGAAIAFHTANGGEANFAQGILDLAAAGCKVIVDDIIYLGEPFFQDGIVGQAVNQVVNNNGVTYFSSAGNRVRASYQAPFKIGGTYSNSAVYGTSTAYPTYDFSTTSTVDNLQRISIPSGQSLRLVFQWDNPYQSVSGGTGATTDLDIFVLNSTTGAVITRGTTDQSSGGDPLEITGTVTNSTGSPRLVDVVIVKRSGPDPGLIKWVNFSGNNIAPEYATNSGASYGHNTAAGCISTGAAGWFDTPVFNGALTTAIIEPFSSVGGTPILFNTDGSRINGIVGTVRQKPEITAVDGGNNTFFGSDTNRDPDAFPNFFGTSAAAPHAAAVAALMMEKVPSITRNTILSTMQSTALDMDDPFTAGFDTGFDFGTGFGFIQADRALQAISSVAALSLVVSANPNVILTSGTTTLSATVSGGTTPYSYTFSGPGTITQSPSSNTASVSGLPAGVQTFTVVARDATTPTSQSISGTVSVTVNMTSPSNTPPTVANPVSPQSATVGVGYTLSLANVFTDAETPNGLTLSVSGLPAGLSFSAPSTISGTPSMSGVSSVTVVATDPGSLTASNTFTLTVSPAASATTPGAFAITGATTVSCTTLSAGLRSLTFNPQYAGLDGSPVSFSVANELLPTTAPGPYTLNLYTDNPVITLKATQSGSEASFAYNWLVTCNGGTPPPPPPTPGPFSITGVTTVSCSTLSAGLRSLTFNPQYAGLDGSPVSFSVANEMLPTTAPGPYTLNLYTDNPVITLKATQSGSEASFAYNWIVACNGGTPGSARVGAELRSRLKATILPNPVSDEFQLRIEGALGQSVRLELVDVSGHSLVKRLVEVSDDTHQESVRFNQPGRGLYLLRVSTGEQALTLKVIRE